MMSTSSEHHDPESIMASIAAVKEILNMNNNNVVGDGGGGGFGYVVPETTTTNTITNINVSYYEDQINEIKQRRYEDVRKLQDQLDTKCDEIRRLKSDLQELTCEVNQERSLRITIEETSEAINQHTTQLKNQISTLIKSKESLQKEITSLRINQQSLKEISSKQIDELESQIDTIKIQQNNTLQEIGIWEAKFLSSQRENSELKNQLQLLLLSKKNTTTTTTGQNNNNNNDDADVVVVQIKKTATNNTDDTTNSKDDSSLPTNNNVIVNELKLQHKQAMDDLKEQVMEFQTGHKEALRKTFYLQREIEELKNAAGKLQTTTKTTTTTSSTAAGSSPTALDNNAAKDVQKQLLTAKKSQLKTRSELNELKKQHKESMDDLQDQLKKEQDAHKETRNKVEELTTKLSHAEREMSQDEIEAEKEMEQQLIKKHTKLTESYGKVTNHIENLQTQISEGVATQRLKNDLLIETSKMGALMESLQDASKDKLKAAKAKADKLTIKLESVRELWKVATEDVENAKVEYDTYVSKIEQLQKDAESIEGGEHQKSGRRGSGGEGKAATSATPPKKRQKKGG